MALAVVRFVAWATVYGYTNRPGWVGVAHEQLWDWLDLLIIPFVLGVGGGIGGVSVYTFGEPQRASDRNTTQGKRTANRGSACARRRTTDVL
jgi:hypothetical protein